MKHNQSVLTVVCASSLAVTSVCHAASVAQLGPFNPTTEFSAGFSPPGERGYQAGLDFNDGTSSNYPDPTQAGFLGIANSNDKSYNVTTNGITFDINVSNANLTNQNRNRNNVNAGRLMTDFEQWFGDLANSPEASFEISGLVPNEYYEIGFYQANVGAGQTTHSFYDGTSSSDPLLGTIGTSGSQNNYATWFPGTLWFGAADGSGNIDITVQANGQRLTLAGVTVFAVPEPSSTALLGLGGLALIMRRRR